MSEKHADPGEASPSGYKYWAFISYSSKDKKWANWLFRSLETYGVPVQFVSHPTPVGDPAPKVFRPVFRDRDELAAHHNLGETIETALRASRYLIVLCSPDAAKSPWVDKELRFFRSQHGPERVFAVIVRGSPLLGAENDCFPPALREMEPKAPDARPEGDGKRNAKLMLVAAMLGVEFDALRRRDHERQTRRLTAGLSVAACLVVVMAWLAWAANEARKEANVRRDSAGILISYMTDELSHDLASIGRTDLIEKALRPLEDYARKLPDDDDDFTFRMRRTAQRQRALLDLTTGHHERALTSIEAGVKALEAKVRAEPDNDLWHDDLGNALETLSKTQAALGQREMAEATARRAVAEAEASVRLNDTVPLSKHNLAWKIKDLAKRLDGTTHQDERIALCQKALGIEQSLLKADPGNIMFRRHESAFMDELGLEFFAAGKLKEAREQHAGALRITEELLQKDSGNNGYFDDKSTSLINLSEVELESQHLELALNYLRQAETILMKLVEFDPENGRWRGGLAAVQRRMGTAFYRQHHYTLALEAFSNALRHCDELVRRDTTSFDFASNKEKVLGCIADTKAELNDIAGARATAAEARESVASFYQATPDDYMVAGRYAAGWLSEANLLSRHGQNAEAVNAFREVIKIDQAIAANYPNAAIWQNNLRLHSQSLGRILRDLGTPTESVSSFEVATTAARNWLKLNPNSNSRAALAEACAELAEALRLLPMPDKGRITQLAKEGMEAVAAETSSTSAKADALRARLTGLLGK